MDQVILDGIADQLQLTGYNNPDKWMNDDFDNVMNTIYRSLSSPGTQDGTLLDQLKKIKLIWPDPRNTTPITKWNQSIRTAVLNSDDSDKNDPKIQKALVKTQLDLMKKPDAGKAVIRLRDRLGEANIEDITQLLKNVSIHAGSLKTHCIEASYCGYKLESDIQENPKHKNNKRNQEQIKDSDKEGDKKEPDFKKKKTPYFL
jgi:hypothetical protein